MIHTYADSTIAISVYNLLVKAGRPMPIDEINDQLITLCHPLLKINQTQRAIKRLITLRLICESSPTHNFAATHKFLIVGRSRNDMIARDNGTIDGGWTWWIWRDDNGTVTPVFPPRQRRPRKKASV